MKQFNFQDHYFHQAKKEWYLARSVYKLKEIDDKYKLFDKNTKFVLDVWAAPWSWSQYASKKIPQNWKLVWIDIKPISLKLENWIFYEHDATDIEFFSSEFDKLNIKKFDVIISDMAPNTIGFKDVDSIRSMMLIEKTLPIYENFLKKDWKFAIKVFMWPGFEEFVKNIRKIFGAKNMKTFKPQACRKDSKETYIIRY